MISFCCVSPPDKKIHPRKPATVFSTSQNATFLTDISEANGLKPLHYYIVRLWTRLMGRRGSCLIPQRCLTVEKYSVLRFFQCEYCKISMWRKGIGGGRVYHFVASALCECNRAVICEIEKRSCFQENFLLICYFVSEQTFSEDGRLGMHASLVPAATGPSAKERQNKGFKIKERSSLMQVEGRGQVELSSLCCLCSETG